MGRIEKRLEKRASMVETVRGTCPPHEITPAAASKVKPVVSPGISSRFPGRSRF
jgi:hypothetical protein